MYNPPARSTHHRSGACPPLPCDLPLRAVSSSPPLVEPPAALLPRAAHGHPQQGEGEVEHAPDYHPHFKPTANPPLHQAQRLRPQAREEGVKPYAEDISHGAQAMQQYTLPKPQAPHP